jgi:hypothetical protein
MTRLLKVYFTGNKTILFKQIALVGLYDIINMSLLLLCTNDLVLPLNQFYLRLLIY